jgi:hypothetical protein
MGRKDRSEFNRRGDRPSLYTAIVVRASRGHSLNDTYFVTFLPLGNPLIAYGLIGLIIGLILDTIMVCTACLVSALSVRYHDKHYYVVISLITDDLLVHSMAFYAVPYDVVMTSLRSSTFYDIL